MDCRHKTTKTFSIFVTAHLLAHSEIRREAHLYQNFLKPDGAPKGRGKHRIGGNYSLAYYRDMIVDEEVKRKLEEIRKYLGSSKPALKEEYTKRRLVYWSNSNQCLYTLEPRRKSLWLGVVGKRNLKGYRKHFDHNKTYFKVTGDMDIKNVLGLCVVKT